MPEALQTPASSQGERVVSESDKKLSADWRKRIDGALDRVKDDVARFERGRRLMAGNKNGEKLKKDKVRANLHYADMAAMLPQIYAKDPEFAAQPTLAVPPDQLAAVRKFAKTAEFMLTKIVVKDARLKAQAKKLVRSAFGTSVGWLKASWQEKMGKDPLIANKIKDTQDNIARIQMLMDQANDPAIGSDHALKLAQLKEALGGLETQAEITIAKGIPLDFVMSEDVIVIDAAVRSVTDYLRAGAIAHRVWMTPDAYQTRFGYRCKKGKTYSEQAGVMSGGDASDKSASLLCVYEVWSQDDNRIFYLCDGEEGFCEPPSSPDWTGKRWYPFFLCAFNEIDGKFYPLSDVELTEKVIDEHNQTRDDAVRDRKACLPVNVVRKGGSLTDDDVKRITNREGSDVIMVEGVGGQPLSNDMFIGTLGKMDPMAYDTSQSLADKERLLGGGDAPTGSIQKAKTATEAQILSNGLRGRAAERTDVLEDLLNELGPYALEIMLRKFSPQEVKALAGPEAEWPVLSIDDIFNLVTVEVRAGSTGKPDAAQEQERWIKLLPIINEAVAKVGELRQAGQENLAQAVIEITRETLRRFDERIDIEQFLPKVQQGQNDPGMMAQELTATKQQLQTTMEELKKMNDLVQKGLISAAASIATSQDPGKAVLAFLATLGQIDPGAVPPNPPEMPPMAGPQDFPQQTAPEPLPA